MGRPATDLQRLITRVVQSNTKQYDGIYCLEWTGTLDKDGYAQVSYLDKRYRVSRLIASIYLDFSLESPLYVCHHCDNRKCIEPKHFFIGTPHQNTRDGIRKGRIVPFVTVETNHNELKTHCIRGHEFTESNTYIRYNGSRMCRTCNRLRTK